jgi:uncharacterized protein YndB with AHSA1/START domain
MTRAPGTPPKPAAEAPREARWSGVGDAKVKGATGKTWAGWIAALDGAGGRDMSHKDIAAHLANRYHVPGWWCQTLTVGYEQAIGRRVVNQKSDGTFSAHASTTFEADLAQLYAAWSDASRRERWLPGAPLEVRKATEGKLMRITWTEGPSNVDVYFSPVDGGRSRVQVEHGKLPDEAARTRQKEYWKDALERLQALFEKG